MRLRLLLYDFEFWIALMSIGFGIWISSPAFTTASAPALRAMLELVDFDRLPWAIAFSGCGLIHLVALIRYENRIRAAAALVLAPLWVIVGVVGARYMGNATPSYILTGIAYAVVYMRVSLGNGH